MRSRPWQGLASAALACVALAAGAVAVHAGPPNGQLLARDARETPVVDELGRLVYMTKAGMVRLLDPVDPTRGRDVAQCGDATQDDGSAVAAAAQGIALVYCVHVPTGPFDASTAAFALDLATGERAVVATPQPLSYWDTVQYTGIDPRGVCYVASAYKSPSQVGRFDWRSGAVTVDGTCAGTVPRGRDERLPLMLDDGPGGRPLVLAVTGAHTQVPFAVIGDAVVAWGVRTLAPRMRLYAYLRDCGVRLGWDTSPLTRAVEIPGGLVLAESWRGGGPVALRRVDLADACTRLGTQPALTLTGSKRAVVLVRPQTALGADPQTGAETQLLRPARIPRAALGGAGAVRIRLTTPARRVRWRLGAGGAHAAHGTGVRWTLPSLPRLRRGRTLTLDVRFDDVTSARYEVRAR